MFMFPLQFMKTVLFPEKDCKQSFIALLHMGKVHLFKMFFTSWAEVLTERYSLTSYWWLSSGEQLTQTHYVQVAKIKV